jgi:hypothetical protein
MERSVVSSLTYSDKPKETLAVLIDACWSRLPATSKGVYSAVAVSSTMGVGVRVDTQTTPLELGDLKTKDIFVLDVVGCCD